MELVWCHTDNRSYFIQISLKSSHYSLNLLILKIKEASIVVSPYFFEVSLDMDSWTLSFKYKFDSKSNWFCFLGIKPLMLKKEFMVILQLLLLYQSFIVSNQIRSDIEVWNQSDFVLSVIFKSTKSENWEDSSVSNL